MWRKLLTCATSHLKSERSVMFKETLQTIVENTDWRPRRLDYGHRWLIGGKVFTEEGSAANLDVAAAELTSLIRSASRSGNDLNLGELRELVVAHDKVTFVMRFFSKRLFRGPGPFARGNIGRGRYELRKAELMLAKEFTV